MTDNILMRAKRFIGLEGEDYEEISENTQQVKLDHFIRVKKEAPKNEGEYEIGFFEPKIYEDSLNIATGLRSGNPMIVSLKHLDPSCSCRSPYLHSKHGSRSELRRVAVLDPADGISHLDNLFFLRDTRQLRRVLGSPDLKSGQVG